MKTISRLRRGVKWLANINAGVMQYQQASANGGGEKLGAISWRQGVSIRNRLAGVA
jgi:hypothetical protein